jgi:hypothetical protein
MNEPTDIEVDDGLDLCDGCGYEVEKDDIHIVKGKKYCSYCLDEFGDEL